MQLLNSAKLPLRPVEIDLKRLLFGKLLGRTSRRLLLEYLYCELDC